MLFSIGYVVLGLAAAPFLLGIVNRTKSFFAGRRGQPLLQLYFDLWKLAQKGAVYSRTTTWVFRASPVVGLACMWTVLMLLPVCNSHSLVWFDGDLILFVYLFGLMRFFTVIAALDTGSSFEGMGASREVFFSALAEPALIFGLAALARKTNSISLSDIFGGTSAAAWMASAPVFGLVAVAFMIVFLAENSRIPVDDPNTHLELTMIHEVMILDYSGPDLAMVLYSASLKFWVLGALVVNIFLPLASLSGAALIAVFVGGMVFVSLIVGTIESAMARLSLLKVPQLLVGAGVLSTLAFVLVLRYAQ